MSLQEQIDDIKKQLSKQAAIVAKTAQQVLAMQVKDTKQQMDAIPNPLSQAAAIDTTDFATNEDLVQLVGELQGQLNILEQKSVLRAANNHQEKEEDLIIALPNLDGEFPPADMFPHSIAELKALDDDKLILLSSFYQLLPPELEEEAKEHEEVKDDQIPPSAKEYPPGTLDLLYEDLASFLGLSHIRRD